MATARHLKTGMTATPATEIGPSASTQVTTGPVWVFGFGVAGTGAGSASAALVDSATIDTPVKWRQKSGSTGSSHITFIPPLRMAVAARVVTDANTTAYISYKAE